MLQELPPRPQVPSPSPPQQALPPRREVEGKAGFERSRSVESEDFDDLAKENEGSGEGSDGEGDVWLLLGVPWMEGFLAMEIDGDQPRSDAPLSPMPDAASADAAGTEPASPSAARAAASPTPLTADSPSAAVEMEQQTPHHRSWKRVWCVVQDAAIALYDHIETTAELPAREPIAEIETSEIIGLSLRSRQVFQIETRRGQKLALRTQHDDECADWVEGLLRLVSWRVVHAVQRECGPEWEAVDIAPAP